MPQLTHAVLGASPRRARVTSAIGGMSANSVGTLYGPVAYVAEWSERFKTNRAWSELHCE